MCLVTLVGSFESYFKQRFIEIEYEGISCDLNKLINKFVSQNNRNDILSKVSTGAQSKNIPQSQEFFEITNFVNFQNLDNTKDAFNAGYGIIFGNFISNLLIDDIREAIDFRHRITHYSPLTIKKETVQSRIYIPSFLLMNMPEK